MSSIVKKVRDLTEHAALRTYKLIKRDRRPPPKPKPPKPVTPPPPPKPESVVETIKVDQVFPSDHGNQIFVYFHRRTRQTIYSLQKHLVPEHLKQLTFVGKQTVPAGIRRDMWTPLCVMVFPNRFQGLYAYARLREFKLRHETEWDPEDFTYKKGPHAGQLFMKTDRKFKLMDQKANSVADMAAVLQMQSRSPTIEEIRRMTYLVDNKQWISKKGDGIEFFTKPHWSRAKYGRNSKIGAHLFEWQGKIEGTTIWWANLYDAEYAETWPAQVLHGNLSHARGQPLWPPPSGTVTHSINIELKTEMVEKHPEQARELLEAKAVEKLEEIKKGTGAEELTLRQKIAAAKARAGEQSTAPTGVKHVTPGGISSEAQMAEMEQDTKPAKTDPESKTQEGQPTEEPVEKPQTDETKPEPSKQEPRV